MKRARGAALSVAHLVALGAVLGQAAAVAAPGDTTRVSVNSGGVEGDSWSGTPSISADGRYVAFLSEAANLVVGDTNWTQDVFVHDRQTGITERVSVDSGGAQLEAGFCSEPSISADGRYVAFGSTFTDLVAGDTNDMSDVFVHDRQTGVTERVSVSSAGAEGNGWSGTESWFYSTPPMSDDGRHVAFVSRADNLVAGDTNGTWDIFVHDRQAGVTERVSVSSAGVEGNGDSLYPSISADGRYVAFYSIAGSLVAGDTNGAWDVFVYDRQTGVTERVSVSSGGAQGDFDSSHPSISADGRYVAFESRSNLAPDDPNGTSDIYVHDRQTGATERVSLSLEFDYASVRPSISADGRYVAFESEADDLVAGDTNGTWDIFVHDRQAGVTERVNVSSGGVEGNNTSAVSSISADGRYAAFYSDASTLVAGDTNGWGDVFVHERGVGVATAVMGAVVLPDLNGNLVGEVAVLRDQAVLEIRDGGSGVLLGNLPVLSAGLRPVAVKPLPDSDGNGVTEVAVLAARQSDGRAVVEIRNLTGAAALRQIWFAANHTPLALAVVSDDADNNGVAEVAVLSRRDSDGRGLVEVKNTFGTTNASSIWSAAGLTPLDLEILPDADGNGVPEVAVMSARDTDGRIVVEVKNATGATNPRAVWFMAGNTALDLTFVADADANGVPEVAVLSRRDSDGRLVVEVKNAAGATNPSSVWFAAGHSGIAVEALPDSDGNGVAEVAVLSQRDSDGRVLVEVKNAAGATNPRALWYPAGYTAQDLAVLADVDGNGVDEAAVLMLRDSDGRIVVQRRNAAGTQAPRDLWFSR